MTEYIDFIHGRGIERRCDKTVREHTMKETCDADRRSGQDFCGFRDHLLEGVKRKCELTIHYLNREEWDFLPRYLPKAIEGSSKLATSRPVLILIMIEN